MKPLANDDPEVSKTFPLVSLASNSGSKRTKIEMDTAPRHSGYFSLVNDENGDEFVRTGNEVLIVPLTAEEEVILTIEPSAAFGEPTIILPGGEIESGEEYAATARRELQEEIGYDTHRLNFLGELRPFSKYLTVRSFVYLARDLVPSQLQGDEDYPILLERVPLTAFEGLIAGGRLLDARVIAALYMARTFLKALE